MTIKKTFAAIFLIFCALSFLQAQNKKSTSDEYLEQLRTEQENAASSKRAEEFLVARRAALFSEQSFFLPNENESWAVSVTTNGGILGGSRLQAAVNSDGNFLCASKGDGFKNNFVEKMVFAEIAQIAKGKFPRLQNLAKKQVFQTPSYCSDCSYETLNIVLRRNKTVEIFQFNLKELGATEPELKRLSEKISNFSECK